VIRFGFATDTYDSDGGVQGLVQAVNVSLEQIRVLASRFAGLIEQMPPPFSAKKIKGVPAYKLARKHQEVALKPVQVEIKEFEILGVQGDQASFRARVASGLTCAPLLTIWAGNWAVEPTCSRCAVPCSASSI